MQGESRNGLGWAPNRDGQVPRAERVALDSRADNCFLGQLEGEMKTQGKVLRVPNVTPGLIMIQGRQLKFSTDTVWKSEIVPAPGLVVNVDLDRDMQIIAVTPVPESQVAKEAGEPTAQEQSGRTLVQESLFTRLAKRIRGNRQSS